MCARWGNILTKDFLYDRFKKNEMTPRQIAKDVGVRSISIVHYFLEKHGLFDEKKPVDGSNDVSTAETTPETNVAKNSDTVASN